MLHRTSITSNQSRLRSERDATAIADSMASETDLSELPTTSVFTYVRLVAICPSLLCREKFTTLAVRVSAKVLSIRSACGPRRRSEVGLLHQQCATLRTGGGALRSQRLTADQPKKPS